MLTAVTLEIDPEQPQVRASWLSAFRHYTNLHRCEARLHRLLLDFEFAPLKEVLGVLPVPTVNIVGAFADG